MKDNTQNNPSASRQDDGISFPLILVGIGVVLVLGLVILIMELNGPASVGH